MLVAWHEVGHVRVAALLDGDADLAEPVEHYFPDIPGPELEAGNAAMPGIVGAGGRWHLFVRAWLLLHPSGTTLVDTGVGGADAPAATWFPRTGRLVEALREAGTSPDGIDRVVLTHVHDDHVEGTVVGEPPVPAFPRARYLIQRADLDHQRSLADEDPAERAVWERLLRPLVDAGAVDALDGDLALSDDVELRAAPGHTPGHQVVRISSRGRRLLLAADAFTHPAQVGRPDLPGALDAEPGRAAATRRALLAWLLSNPGAAVSVTHFDRPFGVVAPGRDGLAAWRPSGAG